MENRFWYVHFHNFYPQSVDAFGYILLIPRRVHQDTCTITCVTNEMDQPATATWQRIILTTLKWSHLAEMIVSILKAEFVMFHVK